MPTTAGDIYVRSGNTGAFTEAKFVQGGWITVASGSDMHALDESRVAEGQIVYVQETDKAYIVSKFEAFVTPGYDGFINSRSFAEFNFPGTGGGGGTTELNSFSSSILTYTGSTDLRIDSIETVTGSLLTYTGSTDTRLSSIEVVTASFLTYTGSTNTRLEALETFTGSQDFVTLGVNTFTGSQTITDILILGSQSVQPTAVDGGMYFDTNYNLYIGQ